LKLPLTPDEAAHVHAFGGVLTAEDMRDLALAWLEQGLDAPHLRELASERSAAISDVSPVFRRVMLELGADPDPGRAAARRVTMKVLLQRVADARENVSGCVWAAMQPLYFTKEGGELSMLGALYWEADDPSLTGRRLSLIEDDMREEAKRVLANLEHSEWRRND
jgi:hypothetical protein